jgi:hypothetical protein
LLDSSLALQRLDTRGNIHMSRSGQRWVSRGWRIFAAVNQRVSRILKVSFFRLLLLASNEWAS